MEKLILKIKPVVIKGPADEHTNLTYVCPNCHRMIHSNIIKSKDLISIHDYIGDEWKKNLLY